MYDEGFGAGVAELVMCWIAAGDNVVPPCTKMPGKDGAGTRTSSYRFHRACLTQQ